MSTAIVGAGVAGLSLALMLDDDVTIFEKSNKPGGLSRSTKRGPWTWDNGPHILGGIPEAVEWVKTSTGIEFVEGNTNNRAWKQSVGYLNHPFDDTDDIQSYMSKMWKTNPDKLTFGGLNAQVGRKPGGVSAFSYPKRGGYQAITDAWADQLGDCIIYDTEFTESDLLNFDRVVWTAPVKGMRYNVLTLVTACCWGPPVWLTALYLPDKTTPFHRLSFPANFSSENAPKDGVIIQAEMTTSDIPQTEALQRHFFSLIEQLDMVESFETIETKTIPFAYPIPSIDAEVKSKNPKIIYHGRTGGYRYLNIDGVIDSSMKLAERLNAQ